MKRRRRKPVLAVRGDESVFECAQTILAALTLAQEGAEVTTGAIEAVLRLPAENAVLASWTILTGLLNGFDHPEEIPLVLQVLGEAIAKHEDTYNGAFAKK